MPTIASIRPCLMKTLDIAALERAAAG